MIPGKKTAYGTILVTGGAGCIGSHVVRQLGEAGHTVIDFMLLEVNTSRKATNEFIR